jgi:hypothetical protein
MDDSLPTTAVVPVEQVAARERSCVHRTMDLMQPPIPSNGPKAPPPPQTSSEEPPREPTKKPTKEPTSRLKKVIAVLVACVSALYLINPTLGLFELLPDALPLIGNLDEAFFTLALVSALGALGLELPFLRRR